VEMILVTWYGTVENGIIELKYGKTLWIFQSEFVYRCDDVE
jgi:hypothetical protein